MAKGASKLETARKAFVRAYVKEHPKQTRAQAVGNANRSFRSAKTRATLPRSLRGAHTRVYAAPKYPRLYKAARAFGMSSAKAKKASDSLYKLNHAFYHKRDHPPKEEHLHFPREALIERSPGQYEFVLGESETVYEDMAKEQIEMEHYDDFYDWWDEYFGEDTWEDRHEIYSQEG